MKQQSLIRGFAPSSTWCLNSSAPPTSATSTVARTAFLSFFRGIFEKETKRRKRYFSEVVAVGPWAVLRRQHDARNVGAFTSTKKPMWRLYWIRKYVELLLWLTQECTLVVHRGGYLDPHDQNCDSIHKYVELLLGRFHIPGWFRWYYKEQNAGLQ